MAGWHSRVRTGIGLAVGVFLALLKGLVVLVGRHFEIGGKSFGFRDRVLNVVE